MKTKMKVKVIKCVPYQLCPVCKGDGGIFTQPIVEDKTVVVSGYKTCDVCNGTRIIPMFVITKKEE